MWVDNYKIHSNSKQKKKRRKKKLEKEGELPFLSNNEKYLPFECEFHSFLKFQLRSPNAKLQYPVQNPLYHRDWVH